MQISALRRILDQGRSGQGSIQTVSGRGYRFLLPITPAIDAQTPLAPPVQLAETMRRTRRPWLWLAASASLAVIAVVVAVTATGGWFAGQPRPRLSLVVLPFDNLAGNSNDDYLAAAVTDDLTADLSHIPGSFVIARATAYTYRGKSQDIRQIGHDLAVRYVVHGSVQRIGQVMRVVAELASTENGAQLWSDSFDQPIDDLAAGQQQIVVRMRSALNISLADIEAARSLRERPANPDAFDLILRARAIDLRPRSKETISQVLTLYQQALDRDPNAVLALTGMTVTLLNAQFYDMLRFDVAVDQASHYFARARTLRPNAEAVMMARLALLDWQQDGLDYQRIRSEMEAVSRQLIEYYPNNPTGYFELGVLRRNTGHFAEAINGFTTAERLNPRNPQINNVYWNLAFCHIVLGHDQEGLRWADRALAAGGSLPIAREHYLLAFRTVAFYRLGDTTTAKRLARELNDRFPYDTWREHYPEDPELQMDIALYRSVQDALKAAGNRDHLDPDIDSGLPSRNVLLSDWDGGTPRTVPGVTTLNTEQLAQLLQDAHPLLIDTMNDSWYRSIPGSVGLIVGGNSSGTFSDAVQQRLQAKLRDLTGGDPARPIIVMSFNAAQIDGYNIALRLHHAGYTNVYWYRGGREAWEVAGKQEEALKPTDW